MDTKLIAIGLTVILITYMVITDRLVGTSYSISNSWNEWRKKKGYGAAFVIFLTCIALGLWLIVDKAEWKHHASPILLMVGGFSAYAIGIYANFKQGRKESTWHNVYSAATFGFVLLAFYIQGIKFPLESFVLLSAVLLPIDIPKKTTIIEVVGIGLAIMGVYYL